MKRAEVENEIVAHAPSQTLRLLAIDPDAHQPGAAFYLAETHENARCWVWGGNRTGDTLATPDGAQWLLERLRPNLVLVEAQLPGRGSFTASMAPQNIVRGGWAWLCELQAAPCVLVPPLCWQRARHPGSLGPGGLKRAYKARACELLNKKTVNEDAAAALGILEFGLGVLGHELPAKIFDTPP